MIAISQRLISCREHCGQWRATVRVQRRGLIAKMTEVEAHVALVCASTDNGSKSVVYCLLRLAPWWWIISLVIVVFRCQLCLLQDFCNLRIRRECIGTTVRSTKIWAILATSLHKILLESDTIEVSCQVIGFLFLVVMCSHLLPYMAILNEIPLSPETKSLTWPFWMKYHYHLKRRALYGHFEWNIIITWNKGCVTISALLPSCSECCRDFEHLWKRVQQTLRSLLCGTSLAWYGHDCTTYRKGSVP